MNGWEFQDGMYFASRNSNGNASIKCIPYSWPGMAGYAPSYMTGWVSGCGVSNTSNCKK